MKKLIALLSLAGFLTFGVNTIAFAQDETNSEEKADAATEQVEEAEEAPTAATSLEAPEDGRSFHQVLKDKYIEGGAGWMTPILICLIFGLALCIERIIYLNLADTNAKKLLDDIESAMKEGSVEKAKELCRNTRGPLASVFFQALDRADEGLEIMEKSVVSYGSVQTARLEANLTWIGLFIAVAPMFGFLGTVVGMVGAFDAIEAAGDISPTVVAGGMKVALITTIFGIIVGLILQFFYNYIVAKISTIVNRMEDATISFMDIMYEYKK